MFADARVRAHHTGMKMQRAEGTKGCRKPLVPQNALERAIFEVAVAVQSAIWDRGHLARIFARVLTDLLTTAAAHWGVSGAERARCPRSAEPLVSLLRDKRGPQRIVNCLRNSRTRAPRCRLWGCTHQLCEARGNT